MMETAALKVLVAPDSFKGSLSATEVADRIRAGIRRAVPRADVTLAPIADGGEGTAEVLAATLPGVWEEVIATDANGAQKPVRYFRGHTPEFGELAIFEVAEVVGLPYALVEPGQRTTRGIGHVIRAIADRGVDTIAIGLGGSSTNDAGAGLLAETGFRFADAEGNALWPTLDTLDVISGATCQRPAQLGRVRLLGLSDVNNPLCGPNGATFVFGTQKGVQDLAAADARLERFAKRCVATVGEDVRCGVCTGRCRSRCRARRVRLGHHRRGTVRCADDDGEGACDDRADGARGWRAGNAALRRRRARCRLGRSLRWVYLDPAGAGIDRLCDGECGGVA